MAIDYEPVPKSLFADKSALLKILEQQDAETGFVPDRTMTVERLHEMMLADGVRPGDCIASREIIRMREE